MTREIKFRAWHKKKGMIKNPTSMSTIVSRFIREFRPSSTGFGSRAEEVTKDEYILMQYTGFKDKNGEEIYEGDIMNDGRDIFQVKFVNGAFLASKNGYGVILMDHLDAEIIGNIYENPELLKSHD